MHEVRFNGCLGDRQLPTDRPIGEPSGNEGQYLQFTFCRCFHRFAAQSPDQPGGNRCGKDGLASKLRAVRRPAPGMPVQEPKRPVVTYTPSNRA